MLQSQAAALAVFRMKLPMEEGTLMAHLIETVPINRRTIALPVFLSAVECTAFGTKGIFLAIIGLPALVTTHFYHGTPPF